MSNKKLFAIFFVSLAIAIIMFAILFFQNFSQKNLSTDSEKVSEKISPILVEKIVLFSSASALNDYSNPWWNLNVYQYSDIAIYLKQNEHSKEAKSIVLDNFKYIDGPNLGLPFATYISPLNLGKNSSEIHSAKQLENITFEIKNSSLEESFEEPTFFNNFTSPLTFRYINKDIVKDFILKSEASSSLTFDGTLLQKCSIKKDDISCKLSFDITYIISEEESYKYNIVFDLLLENSEQSIFDGNLLETIYPENFTVTQL